MILACTRLNWQIHFFRRLMRLLHKTGELPIPKGNSASNIRAAARHFSRVTNDLTSTFFVIHLGLFRSSESAGETVKNSDVTWCYNPRAGLTLFGSTTGTARNKLLDRPVGGYARHVDAPL
jgi:hypothetical protein